MSRPYVVVPYSTAWPEQYLRHAEQLRTLPPGFLTSLDHIGSTSIEGLSAKPIIDMLGTVMDIDVTDRYESLLLELGYTALGEFGLPGRRYFVLERQGTRLVNLHIFAKDHPDVKRHLAFRDYLRQHPEARDQYDQLKQALYRAAPDDLDAYMDGKDAWIKDTERRALQSRQPLGGEPYSPAETAASRKLPTESG